MMLFAVFVYSPVDARWTQVWCPGFRHGPMNAIEAFELMIIMSRACPDATYELREWLPP